eukprot:TRINITY_DN10787_c0_g1_i1.p1 TRINITY_DN10787_c0_g1~~TRINITY_DN10787_c0_g1_i1.p1  ORF type:complete len:189 (-),score=8.46 TRINITY_DN10787_c0_g1_i1:17-583(-)
MASKSLLITVGSTNFDSLISAIDTLDFLFVMRNLRIYHLNLQIGNGSYLPTKLVPSLMTSPPSSDWRNEVFGYYHASSGVSVSVFRYCNDLTRFISDSVAVISHGGAGTMMEVATAGKHLIVVSNATLMAGHQDELAAKFNSMGLCTWTNAAELLSILPVALEQQTGTLPLDNRKNFSTRLQELMGLQ